jgi:hypothetical protein
MILHHYKIISDRPLLINNRNARSWGSVQEEPMQLLGGENLIVLHARLSCHDENCSRAGVLHLHVEKGTSGNSCALSPINILVGISWVHP